MKYFFAIVPILFIAGCSAPQQPLISNKPSPIPNLVVSDTDNFGFIPVGGVEYAPIQFENTGNDTIFLSQSFSPSNVFDLPYPEEFSTSFWIAPGKKMPFRVRGTGRDTLSHEAFDTIRSGSYEDIVDLRSSWKYFSSMFPRGMNMAIVSLSGLQGNWSGNPSHGFDFYAEGSLLQWGDTLVMQGMSDAHTTATVSFRIDTSAHLIKWLYAILSYEDGSENAPHWYATRSESITAHDIPLTLQDSLWTANLNGTIVSSLIDTATYEATAYPWGSGENATLISITGYASNASLSIYLH